MESILREINSFTTKENLDNYIKNRIEELSRESAEYNQGNVANTLGSIIGINSYEEGINREELGRALDAWISYIPSYMRIVYATCHDEINRLYNRGGYYYLDDDKYLYDFIYYIKDKKINNLNEVMVIIFNFLYMYLYKAYNPCKRDRIHLLILENPTSCFKPTKEHSIKDFYHNGAALCSEYAALAQNIMSFLNLDPLFLMDKGHVFNLMQYKDKYYIVDNTDWVGVYDINLKYVKRLPFIVEIEGCNEEMLQSVIDRKKAFEFDDFDYIQIKNKLIKYYYKNKIRRYACGSKPIEEKKIVLK